MIYILNGKNYFLKEFHVSTLINSLDNSYEIDDIIIDKSDKPDAVQSKLEDMLIKLSMDGFFSSEFCGVVSIPPHKATKSKKKPEERLLYNLVQYASNYCSAEKQLIIYTPDILSEKEKQKITELCNDVYHKFIDLNYVSNSDEIYNFCSETINNFGLKFATKQDQDEFILSITTSAQCTTNSNGDLVDITMFTYPKDIVYDQHFLYSIIFTVYCFGLDYPPLVFSEIENFLIKAQLKSPLHILLGKIFKCNSVHEVLSATTEVFELLNKSELGAFLTYFKGCLFDYIKVSNGESKPTRKSKMISNGNFKLTNPEKLYQEIDSLSKDKTLSVDSYRNDLTLFLLEQFSRQ